MTKRLFLLIAVIISGFAIILAGCRSAETVNSPSGTSSQEVPLVPYSKGPTSPPYVKGPSGPPPVTANPSAIGNDGSQAVTETETIRYSLPENPDIKVKQ